MRTVTLGRTGLTVSKTAFGTVPIQRLPEADAIALLRQAYDGGITFFDTADTYTTSEMRVGKAFEGMMHKITVATKFPAHLSGSVGAYRNSLRALKTDCIDLLQLHNPPQCYADHDGTTRWTPRWRIRKKAMSPYRFYQPQS
jgi:aryl-alcohol dehydrogenase-like predicted oxidoreductase